MNSSVASLDSELFPKEISCKNNHDSCISTLDSIGYGLVRPAAEQIVANVLSGSRVLNQGLDATLPRLKSVSKGKLLGQGSFNEVWETSLLLGKRKRTYAIKALKLDNHDQEPVEQINATADLMLEARFLANIQHPNIVRLHALTTNGDEFGLVLDRLDKSMSHKLKEWRESGTGPSWTHRLHIAKQISSALSHLHSLYIVFRDLKPNNLVFTDSTCTRIKLIDFGLAKELDPREQVSTTEYEMSGQTGSLAYMSPEVYANQPYGCKADVFSFSIVLWQLLSIQPEAYPDMTVADHKTRVIQGAERPSLSAVATPDVQTLLKKGWHTLPSKRPNMQSIQAQIRMMATNSNKDSIPSSSTSRSASYMAQFRKRTALASNQLVRPRTFSLIGNM